MADLSFLGWFKAIFDWKTWPKTAIYSKLLQNMPSLSFGNATFVQKSHGSHGFSGEKLFNFNEQIGGKSGKYENVSGRLS